MKLKFIIDVLNLQCAFIFFTFIIFSGLEFMYAIHSLFTNQRGSEN